MQIRVEFAYDREVGSWGFVVPALHIVGSADTRDDARDEALAAIAFALEAEPDVDRTAMDSEVEMIELTPRPSSTA